MTAGLASFVKTHPARAGAAVLLLAMLAVTPGDVPVSQLFYRAGVGFTWNSAGPLEFVRATVPDLVIGSFGVCVLMWIAGLLKTEWRRIFSTAEIAYLATTLLLGPGLVVEALLKPHWGRARPKDLSVFGGAAAYTPPWQIADQCDHNCSFVSGHAAIAFWVTAYAFLLPPRWRVAGMLAGLVFGFAVGAVRIMQGAHFLSDVVAAGLIVLLINEVCAAVFLKPRAP